MKIAVTGLDPSMRNWGIAQGVYDTDSQVLSISHLDVVQPVLTTSKQVRQNSKDLESAQQLFAAAYKAVKGTQAIFVEVPVGSQSARAMCGYGLCLGVLGSLRASGIPFFEVTPTEVKMISVGKKTATKSEMIHWAYNRHPEAKWPTYKQHGQDVISEAKAEHMADAVAAIHAGLASNQFQQTLPFLRAA